MKAKSSLICKEAIHRLRVFLPLGYPLGCQLTPRGLASLHTQQKKKSIYNNYYEHPRVHEAKTESKLATVMLQKAKRDIAHSIEPATLSEGKC